MRVLRCCWAFISSRQLKLTSCERLALIQIYYVSASMLQTPAACHWHNNMRGSACRPTHQLTLRDNVWRLYCIVSHTVQDGKSALNNLLTLFLAPGHRSECWAMPSFNALAWSLRARSYFKHIQVFRCTFCLHLPHTFVL